LRLETATRSDILYLFGQGNDFLLGKNQGIYFETGKIDILKKSQGKFK